MKRNPQGRKDLAKEDKPKETLDNLFYDPPKLKGLPMTTKLTELQQKIDALKKEHDELLEKEKSEAIEQINAIVKTYGIKAIDLDFGNHFTPQPQRRSGSKVTAKYQSNGQTWTGRGRKPKWVEDHLKTGGRIDELLIR